MVAVGGYGFSDAVLGLLTLGVCFVGVQRTHVKHSTPVAAVARRRRLPDEGPSTASRFSGPLAGSTPGPERSSGPGDPDVACRHDVIDLDAGASGRTAPGVDRRVGAGVRSERPRSDPAPVGGDDVDKIAVAVS